MVATLRSSRKSRNGSPPPPPAEPAKDVPTFKKPGFLKSFLTRMVAGLVMFGFLLAILWAGHVYTTLLIVLMQTMSFRELLVVRYQEYKAQAELSMPLFRSLQWGWFYTALFYVYSDFLQNFALTHESAAALQPLSRYWELAAFSCYCAVFTTSVWTLKVESVKYQVGQLSWTIVTLCIVVGQMKFVAHNIFEGLFWFFFPAWLVIHNDCWAYAWGVLLGKRIVKAPFFKLSPKKTWEGFLGAFFSTIVVGYFTALPFARSVWLTCPATKLTLAPHEPLDCVRPDVFAVRGSLEVPFLGLRLSNVAPIQLHAIALAFFASAVAPFGGFMASAIKRAYDVKDFDSLIPGHGGVTDRVDCQLIMALFVYIYHKTFIKEAPAAGFTWLELATAAEQLPPESKARLLRAIS